MDGHIMNNDIPEGWTYEPSPQVESDLPEGWTYEPASIPEKRNRLKVNNQLGVNAAPDISVEELKKMSTSERLAYAKEAAREREYLQSQSFGTGLLSGATFGATKNIESLNPLEIEGNPYSSSNALGEFTGSLIPLSGLIKIIGAPVAKLAAKSPVFQNQISSLLTMFGVGAAEESLHSVAKGELPSPGEVVENGAKWALLDGGLRAVGFLGNFAKSLFTRSQSSGLPRKDIINNVTQLIEESGIPLTDAERVGRVAMEIIESPITETELAAAERIQLPEVAETSLEEVATERFAKEPISSLDLKTKKITDEPINRLKKEEYVISEPYPLENLNFTTESENLLKDATEEQLERISPRAASEEELGNTIREEIDANLRAARQEYAPLYEQAETAAQTIEHIPQNTAREAGNKLKKLTRLETKPAGYNSVISNLKTVLKDAGFVIEESEGVISQIVSAENVSVDKTIELGRRLNEIIDYEAIEPTVKDVLKSVVKATKQDIRAGLAQKPDALAAFELAEAEHARVAKKFSKKSISSIRNQQAGEKIAKMAESPSTYGELKEVLSPEQMAKVEREALENLKSQTYEKSKKTLREIEKHFAPETKKLAREIVESKNPFDPKVRDKLTQEAVLNDMSKSMSEGTRPDKTLNLWKTKKGQKLIADTFKGSPNWPQVKSYLEQQSFSDLTQSVLRDGKFDPKKFAAFLRDPLVVQDIRAVGGDDAVTFFKNMKGQVEQFQKNTKLLDHLPTKKDIERGKDILAKTKEKIAQKPRETNIAKEALKKREKSNFEQGRQLLERMARKDFPIAKKAQDIEKWFVEVMGINPKAALTVFGWMKLGIPNTAINLLGFRYMQRLLTSTNMRNAFMKASKHKTNTIPFLLAVEEMGNILNEDENT